MPHEKTYRKRTKEEGSTHAPPIRWRGSSMPAIRLVSSIFHRRASNWRASPGAQPISMQVTGTQLWTFLYDTREKVSAAWYASEHEPRPRFTRSHSFDRYYYSPSLSDLLSFFQCVCTLLNTFERSIVIRTILRQLRTFARTKTLFSICCSA